jgi:hypothetical protein
MPNLQKNSVLQFEGYFSDAAMNKLANISSILKKVVSN